MIKRPGNESYLRKLIEEERRFYFEGLEINEVCNDESYESDL